MEIKCWPEGRCKNPIIGLFIATMRDGTKYQGAAFCAEHAIKNLPQLKSLENWVWLDESYKEEIEGERALLALSGERPEQSAFLIK